MKTLLAAATGLLLLTATSASADDFDFTYTTFSGVLVRGQVAATDLGGFFSVDNVTGTRDNAAITGYDFFDDTAQSFTFTGGRPSNVDFSYYVGADNYEIRFPGNGFGTEFLNSTSSDLVTGFTLTRAVVASAAPEPGTWALMIVGFGMVGGAMRRRAARTRTSVRFA